MMIACCIPIAVALVANGVVSAGFVIFAVGCTAMMALLMHGMGHGGGDKAGPDDSTHAHGGRDGR